MDGDAPFVAFAAAHFNVLGADNADIGLIEDFDFHNGLGEPFINPPHFGFELYDVAAGQLTVFGPFTPDNPIDVITFIWRPQIYTPLDVSYVTESLLTDDDGANAIHAWEGEDKDSSSVAAYPVTEADIAFSVACLNDFNGDGAIDILDFVAFQQAFLALEPAADCNADVQWNILDFVCFQQLFQNGCD
jgi:hypothetical protein